MGPSRNERGAGNELGTLRAEQFPHHGNYTLTPVTNQQCQSTDCFMDLSCSSLLLFLITLAFLFYLVY